MSGGSDQETRIKMLEESDKVQNDTLKKLTEISERLVVLETRQQTRDEAHQKVSEKVEKLQLELTKWRENLRIYNWGLGVLGSCNISILGVLLGKFI